MRFVSLQPLLVVEYVIRCKHQQEIVGRTPTEHVFALEVPEAVPVTLAPREHTGYAWMPWREAADRAFSWTNAEAILELPVRTAGSHAAPGGT